MAETHQMNTWDSYVNWKNNPAPKGGHGGLVPAVFVLVVEVLENLAFLATASNLVLYLSKLMHFSPSNSANMVTNFMGTAFLLALLGGFLADAYVTTYRIYLISATIEFLLSTFSVQQAATMNTKIGSLTVPPASLPVFPVLFMMALAPIYSHVIVPFTRKLTKTEMGITHLQRICMGLVLSIIAMAVAATVEAKRRRVADQSGLLNSTEPLPITFLWIALQYLFLGSADLFSLAGMMESFFTEAPFSMRSLAASLSWASLAMGYYMSSVLVTIVNHVTKSFWKEPWLVGNNLNRYRLDRFYWLMCVLSGVNLLHYLSGQFTTSIEQL